ncbi:MAG: glycosyltransferase [Chloroflexi bacterium]|nr:glycosyltransferase [Chloroflexota bacterium]
MLDDRPTVSAVVPAHNAGALIGRCVEAFATQTYPRERFEVVVVDDGSADGTAEAARRDGVRVISQPHRGSAAARNRGARAARGEYLLFTDADCAPAPNWIAEMVGSLSGDQVVGVKGIYRTTQTELLARFVQIEYEGKYARLVGKPRIDFVDTYCAGYRRDVFLANDGFREDLPAAEDVELSYRLAAAGHRLVFNDRAIVYHLHGTDLWRYLQRKFRYGRWRLDVYRSHPDKALGDSHTPPVLWAQIPLAGATLGLAVIGSFLPAARPLAAASLVGFLSTTAPFTWQALRRDRPVGLVAPALLFARAFALGAGLGVGVLEWWSGRRRARSAR